MAEIFKGAAVAEALDRKTSEKTAALREKGIVPTLAILRTGNRPDDISYENNAAKRCGKVGIEVKKTVLDEDVSEEVFFETLKGLNEDPKVHGILMFRPLPRHIDSEKARRMISPAKDIDGCTDGSLAGVFAGTEVGFAPCTAQAAIEILDYYGIECAGKKAAVMGRSLVVGRPVSMMLMHRDATVTTCHTKTADAASITRDADILIVCTGRMESVGTEFFKEGQIIIDVGIGWNEEKGKLCGDVKFDEAQAVAGAVTPVPGGVGTVTTSVLAQHVAEAAERTV